MARPGVVPDQGDVRVPARDVGPLELRPHPRRSDPGALVEGATALHAVAAARHRVCRRLEDQWRRLTCRPLRTCARTAMRGALTVRRLRSSCARYSARWR